MEISGSRLDKIHAAKRKARIALNNLAEDIDCLAQCQTKPEIYSVNREAFCKAAEDLQKLADILLRATQVCPDRMPTPAQVKSANEGKSRT